MQIETSNHTLTIQLRYYFDDENKHTMNAEVFNECERQFIKAIKSTEKYFEDTLHVKIKPREAGSLIDVFTIAINNPAITTTYSERNKKLPITAVWRNCEFCDKFTFIFRKKFYL